MDWIWLVVMTFRRASAAPDDRWAVQLAQLDAVRARAFAESDPRLLRQVYVAGSRARADDAAAISAYARRDGRVVGAHLRVLTCWVISAGDSTVRLDVVDVLTPARVAWADGTTTALPLDQPTRRRITLERTDGGWRIGETRPSS